MKNIVVALATGLVIVSVGMPRPAAAQDSTAGMTAKTRKTTAISRRMTGEVLAVNRGAEALTVRSMTNGKETDVIFSVQYAAAPVLDVREPGGLRLAGQSRDIERAADDGVGRSVRPGLVDRERPAGDPGAARKDPLVIRRARRGEASGPRVADRASAVRRDSRVRLCSAHDVRRSAAPRRDAPCRLIPDRRPGAATGRV